MSEWNWPQWYFATAYAISLFACVVMNGTPRTGKHNGAISILFLGFGIYALYEAGFWK